MPVARFIVSGRVQGVFYRASARDQALELGLTGYAKNRLDGTVEVLASGPAEALDHLQRWLQQGPPAARVDAVTREDPTVQDLPGQSLHGFHTG
jgi:acylphosphatase